MFARTVDSNHQGFLIRKDQSLSTTIKRYRSAVEHLLVAYFDTRPVAIVVGDGRLGRTHVFAKFLDLVADDADVVKINAPCSNAIEFMRQIVQSIGFESKDLSLNDLEGVLDLFLQHQKKSARRTIIAVQEFDSHGWWVLDKIRRLIEGEAENKNGLMVLLSGPPSLNVVLNEPILDVISAHAGDKIELKPFSLSETRDFIRSHVMSSAAADQFPDDIGEVIEFEATNIIHEYCDGIPDDIHRVCNGCLDLLRTSSEKKITTALARQVVQELGLAKVDDESSSNGENPDDTIEIKAPGYLVVEVGGEPTEYIPVMDSSIVFGRDRHCDCCIEGLKVSRFHGLFSMTSDGLVVVDLGSTNGTFVNGEKLERSRLGPDDIVEVGRVRFRYVSNGADDHSQDSKARGESKDTDDEGHKVSSINYAGEAFTMLVQPDAAEN